MRGGGDLDLQLFRPGVVQNVIQTQLAYVDPGRGLPPEEQLYMTSDYKLFILHSHTVFLDFMIGRQVYVNGLGWKSPFRYQVKIKDVVRDLVIGYGAVTQRTRVTL